MASRHLSRMLFYLLIVCCVGFAAHAQQVKPDATPPDPEADSAAAMSLTTHDPRIEKALSGQHGEWKWAVPPVKMAAASMTMILLD